MDREISEAIMLGVKLIAISVVIGLVVMQMTLGNQIKSGAVDTVADIQATLDSSTLDAMSYATGTIVPMVSIYEILYKEHAVVERVQLNGINYERMTFDNSNGDKVTRWISKVNTEDCIDNGEYWEYLADMIDDKGLTGKAIFKVERDSSTRLYTLFITEMNE